MSAAMISPRFQTTKHRPKVFNLYVDLNALNVKWQKSAVDPELPQTFAGVHRGLGADHRVGV